MIKKTKFQTLLDAGYNKQTFPDYTTAQKYKAEFEKQKRDALYFRLGSKGNYSHVVLYK